MFPTTSIYDVINNLSLSLFLSSPVSIPVLNLVEGGPKLYSLPLLSPFPIRFRFFFSFPQKILGIAFRTNTISGLVEKGQSKHKAY